jgi:serine/threonine-protein kinase
MRLRDGQQFAGYRIVRKLGRGGMATVYLAQEESFQRRVALKVLPDDLADDADFVARFRQEAQTIADLEHPNIVPLYRFGIEDAVPWMALRYVDGGDLAHRLAARPLAIGEGLAVLHALAAALDYAHRRGVVHRDLKPQNVLLTNEGQVYLADFGVAKLLERSAIAKTSTGGILGTPAYMAPEQAQGLTLTPAVDVYALGVIAFQWLTGVLPFDADTPHAVLIKHVMEPLPEAPLAMVSLAVADVLRRALAKTPEQRYASASSLVAALDGALRSASADTVPMKTKTSTRSDVSPTTPLPRTDATSQPKKSSASATPQPKETVAAAPSSMTPTPRYGLRRLLLLAIAAVLVYYGVHAYQKHAAQQAYQAKQDAYNLLVPGHYEGFAENQAFTFNLEADGTGKAIWRNGNLFEDNLTWQQDGLTRIEAHIIGLPVPLAPSAAIMPGWKVLSLDPDRLQSGEYQETGNYDRIVRKVTDASLPWPQTGELPSGWLEHRLKISCGANAAGAQEPALGLETDGRANLRLGDTDHVAVWAVNPGASGKVFVVGTGFLVTLGKVGGNLSLAGPLLVSCAAPHYELSNASSHTQAASPPAG